MWENLAGGVRYGSSLCSYDCGLLLCCAAGSTMQWETAVRAQRAQGPAATRSVIWQEVELHPHLHSWLLLMVSWRGHSPVGVR